MEIRVQNVEDKRKRRGAMNLSFEEAELVRGDIEIEFRIDEHVEHYKRSDVNLPLVIAEAAIFLKRLVAEGRATWRFYFAPFVDGRAEGDGFILYTGSHEDPQAGTLEVLTVQQIRKLQDHLSTLEWRYGRLLPNEDSFVRT